MTRMNPGKPKVALMTFGDERDYMWEDYFAGLTEPRHQEATLYLASLPIELISFDDVGGRPAGKVYEQRLRTGCL